jgi:hypothetical protein
MHLNPTNLKITIATAREHSEWKIIMASIGAHQGTAFYWLRRSKKDSDAKLGHDSQFYVEFEGEWAYWHEHLKRSKVAFVEGFQRKFLESCSENNIEYVRDPSTGRKLQKLCDAYLHRDRAWFEANGLDYDFHRFEWERDPITDEILQPLIPVWETRVVQSSVQGKLAALAAMLPKQWSAKVMLIRRA